MEFEAFLRREWDGLSRYARVLADDRSQAEDLLAEALVKVHRHWPRIAAMEQPLAYVRRVLTTTAISHRRAWATRHLRPTAPAALPDLAVPWDAERAVDQRDEVTALLARLPARQRVAVALRYLMDFTDAEIAAEMRCSPGTVRSYIARGLATLRQARPAGS